MQNVKAVKCPFNITHKYIVIKTIELEETMEPTAKSEDKDKKEVFESHLFLQLYLMSFVHPHGAA